MANEWKKNNNTIATTGVVTTPAANGSVPLRHEIRYLWANAAEQWDLFLLGLAALKKVEGYFKPTDGTTGIKRSYYQLAGIHGLPYKEYDGAVPDTKTGYSGYCTHSSPLFATWHRPYLALFEQCLYEKVQDIANQLPPKYAQPAKDFRLPYWDPFEKSQNALDDTKFIPALIADPKITLRNPDLLKLPFVTQLLTQNGSVVNPLFNYTFPKNPDKDEALTADTQTTRLNPDTASNKLKGDVGKGYRTAIVNVMTRLDNFNAFTNDRFMKDNIGTYASLENIHNLVHVDVGGNMGAVPKAAFDPVFWVHHCNIDRLCAIWQSVHPTKYMGSTLIENSASGSNSWRSANFFLADNAKVNDETGLLPFRKDDDSWLTSKDVRYTTKFGYAYPETQRWKYTKGSTGDADLASSAKEAIDKLYNTVTAKVSSLPVSRRVAAPAPTIPDAIKPQQLKNLPTETDQQAVKPTALAELPHADQAEQPSLKYTDWIVNIRVEKHTLPSTFGIMVFLGDVPSDPESWSTSHELVGKMSVLAQGPDTSCDKCKHDQATGMLITGIVPLTEALVDKVHDGDVASLGPNDVEPYLMKNLHWRVKLLGGPEVPRDNVDGLKVIVSSTEVHVVEHLPVPLGVPTLHPAITDGRPGGFSDGDQV